MRARACFEETGEAKIKEMEVHLRLHAERKMASQHSLPPLTTSVQQLSAKFHLRGLRVAQPQEGPDMARARRRGMCRSRCRGSGSKRFLPPIGGG